MVLGRQKQFELAMVTRFRELWENFPDCYVIDKKTDGSDQERPDFILNVGGDYIGLEVSVLHREPEEDSPPERLINVERERVKTAAAEAYEEFGLPPVNVSLRFENDFLPSKNANSEVASELARAVAANLPQKGEQLFLECWQSGRRTLPKGVDFVTISRVPDMRKSFWAAGQGGAIPPLTEEKLRSEISKKDRKRTGYDPNCRAHWLLFCIDVGDNSTFFIPEDDIANKCYESGFDQIALISYWRKSLYWLKRTSS